MNQTIASIQNSFMELYDKQEYDRITVKELCTLTPVARTTFYSYYNNIPDKDFSDVDIEKPEIMSPAQFMERFL